ncbi:phospholipase A1-like [Venturia canescens]|uniref:phospholipase A1-like n=1 Tax=Venturia canescens TaxID=32260 RepID=UPI001C9D3913|nr:phospholipase A1-like [Venturia canescens]
MMKLLTSVWCLLLSIYFAESGLENSLFKWSAELRNFTRGLKVENSVGELVELSIESEPPRLKGLFNSSQVQFFLHTRQSQNSPVQLITDDPQSLNGSRFDSNKHTFLVTHDWMGDKRSRSCAFIRDELLKKQDSNVIVVDWGSIASSDYGTTRLQVRDVGRALTRMIEHLQRVGSLKPVRTTLIGHGVGAHVMGIAGSLAKDPIGVVIGLDPAYPLFVDYHRGQGITVHDAVHVQIIYSDPGFLGISTPRGHTNIHLNNGHPQPECGSDQFHACSHSRAVEYLGESINAKCGYCAAQCRASDPDLCSPACLGSAALPLRNREAYYFNGKIETKNASCPPESQFETE